MILERQEPFQKVQICVLSDTLETFQSMPLKVEIESVDGQYAEQINVKTCLQKVTSSHWVVNCREYQSKWPHLRQCDFPKPADDGLVDLLIGIDNADLHCSHVVVHVQRGGPIAHLGPLNGPVLVPLRTKNKEQRAKFCKQKLTLSKPCL